MAKTARTYVCQSCGTVHPKWGGKCDACGEWNALVEETGLPSMGGGPRGKSGTKGRPLAFSSLKSPENEPPLQRRATQIGELDRVTGGGLVPGAAILIGGDPGIGKSTILLQAAASLARQGAACAYVSGEEAVGQIRMRAARLGLGEAPVRLAAATRVPDIAASMADLDVVIVDSIQTMYSESVDSAPGTVAQVRASAFELIHEAKRLGVCVIFVGHVTKEGQIAGPRVLEHMVDTVLYFEGDRGHRFRILRAVKNRFGPADEIGVFEMTRSGLQEVLNPSELFLSERRKDSTGSAVLAGMEGTRPLLVEVQALVAPSPLATPRRSVVGWDHARLSMILAVLEARCGFQFSGCDVYLNMAGGLRVTEPAADLAVAAALVSSLSDRPVSGDCVFFGEIGLSGEVRPVAQHDVRLKESSKLGFSCAVLPPAHGKPDQAPDTSLTLSPVGRVEDLPERLASAPSSRKSAIS